LNQNDGLQSDALFSLIQQKRVLLGQFKFRIFFESWNSSH